MIRSFSIGLAVAAAALVPAGTWARQTAAAALPVDTSATSRFGAVAAVDNAELSKVTGRDDLTQIVTARNTGVVSGNTISGPSQTGTIRFDSSSFQNLNGLSLLSANTGNNVSINASLNVNVAITAK